MIPDGPPCTGVLNNGKPIYRVELKPKQGWIHDRVHPTCTFCSKQILKLAKNKIKTISGFCPLDLFSGKSIRMRKALKSLMKTPQNNFKIFNNGNVIYDDDSTKYADVSKEIMKPNCKNADAEGLEEKFAALIEEALLKLR